jgi:hypothetical protein
VAYVSIPKDLTAVKTKFVLGLTKRQALCFSGAAATGLPLFFLLKTFMPVSASAMLMVIVMLPWFLFAMYERNGQSLEKFLRCIIAVKLQRPKIRVYQTDNLYAAIGRQIQLNKEVQRIVSNKKI